MTSERRALLAAVNLDDDGSTDADLLARALERDNWWTDTALCDALKGPLMRMAARYLLTEKRANGTARDPVAHLHLSKRARLERLNWLGDSSPNDLRPTDVSLVQHLYTPRDTAGKHKA